MPRLDFDLLPDSGRLWAFGSSRELNEAEQAGLLTLVDDFLEGWQAHGTPLMGARRWVDGRFLLVAVDDRQVPPSGCSVDAMVRELKRWQGEVGVEMVGAGPVFWRDSSGVIRRATRGEFRALAESGDVSPETPVFDLSLTRVGDLRSVGIERPAGESWHRALLPTE